MPELPEVETVKNALETVLVGTQIDRVITRIPKLRYSLNSIKGKKLSGKKITAMERRGRYIIVHFSGNERLLLHLGMSGCCRVVDQETPVLKHEHVLFELKNGKSWRFDDTRRFGFIIPYLAGHEPDCLKNLGPEPLSEIFNTEYLFSVSRNRRCPIKSLIMENKTVTGIGNIYANEALFMAGVDPGKLSGKLTESECEKLVDCIKNILNRAIAAGGTTIVDFKGVDGSEGKFKFELQIYGRATEPCFRCGNGQHINKIKLGGRSTYFCGKCQR